ncbi:MAG: hypothetical protein ACPGKX_01625 [Flavobacteriaceae bacterium]
MSNYLLFRGNFTKSKLIENELIANGIFPIVIDRKQSAILSGFGVNPNDLVEIYVFNDQVKKSEIILKNLAI